MGERSERSEAIESIRDLVSMARGALSTQATKRRVSRGRPDRGRVEARFLYDCNYHPIRFDQTYGVLALDSPVGVRFMDSIQRIF